MRFLAQGSPSRPACLFAVCSEVRARLRYERWSSYVRLQWYATNDLFVGIFQ